MNHPDGMPAARGCSHCEHIRHSFPQQISNSRMAIRKGHVLHSRSTEGVGPLKTVIFSKGSQKASEKVISEQTL